MNSYNAPNARSIEHEEPILLYDGTCGLCARSVQFILTHESEPHALRFATLEGEFGDLYRRSSKYQAYTDSVVWLELTTDGNVRNARTLSQAFLALMNYLGGRWQTAARITRFIPQLSLDLAYRALASSAGALAGALRCWVACS